jgi:hypothetical protein
MRIKRVAPLSPTGRRHTLTRACCSSRRLHLASSGSAPSPASSLSSAHPLRTCYGHWFDARASGVLPAGFHGPNGVSHARYCARKQHVHALERTSTHSRRRRVHELTRTMHLMISITRERRFVWCQLHGTLKPTGRRRILSRSRSPTQHLPWQSRAQQMDGRLLSLATEGYWCPYRVRRQCTTSREPTGRCCRPSSPHRTS